MAGDDERGALFRQIVPNQHSRVTYAELLFDRGWLQPSHGVGIAALGVLAWFASGLSPLLLSILTTAILIVLATWESISLKSGAAGPPSSEAQSQAQSDVTSA